MNFVEGYLKQPHGVLAFLLGGIVFGLLSFQALPLNLFPDANYPAVSVLMVWPGAAAEDVEDKVARRVEKELAGLDLSRKVKSVSRDGVAAVSVEFDYEKSLDAAVADVNAALNRIASILPAGIEAPRLFRISDATTPVVTLAVAARPGSHLDISRIRQLSDNELKEALLRIPDVAQVEVFGGCTPEVHLVIDPVRLAHYNISLTQVSAAVRSHNLNIPAGLIVDEKKQQLIKIAFETETNTALAATEAVVTRMERKVMDEPGFTRMATVVGSEPGVISFGSERTPQEGLITAHFIDRFHRRDTIWQIEERLRAELGRITGLKYVNVYDYGATPLSSISAPVDVMISGPDGRIIDQLATTVSESLSSVRGLTSVSRNWDYSKREIHLKLDPDKLAVYRLDPLRVAQTLQYAIDGNPASVLRVPGEDGHVVRVRYPAVNRDNSLDLGTILIPHGSGWVPLKELGILELAWTRSRFVRQNLQPIADVLGFRARSSISHIQDQVDDRIKHIKIPQGYSVHQEGEIKYMGESFGRLGKAMLLAVLLLYFALVPTFRSFLDPIMIMLAIPLALIGVSWSMLIMGRHLCMPASMGMILLAGITVNNSILLLNFIKTARRRGKTIVEAVEGAISARTRPILMTALSTMVGMLPIAAERAIGLERLSPLAVVTIGGLFVSTLLTLVYVPLFYTLFENLRDNYKRFANR